MSCLVCGSLRAIFTVHKCYLICILLTQEHWDGSTLPQYLRIGWRWVHWCEWLLCLHVQINDNIIIVIAWSENSKNKHSNIFRKLWIFHNFRWFFQKKISPLLCLFIDSLPGFCGYFAFFSMRKKAINIILNDVEALKEAYNVEHIIIFPF